MARQSAQEPCIEHSGLRQRSQSSECLRHYWQDTYETRRRLWRGPHAVDRSRFPHCTERIGPGRIPNHGYTGTQTIWVDHLPANAPMAEIIFENPLKTTAATAMNFACITTGAAVYVNAQGFTAP
jgi:hypothetical protein